jgi:hypothetical protein
MATYFRTTKYTDSSVIHSVVEVRTIKVFVYISFIILKFSISKKKSKLFKV